MRHYVYTAGECPLVDTGQKTIDYLAELGASKVEQIAVIAYRGGKAVASCTVATGTERYCPVSRRIIAAAADMLESTEIALVHNHPSGNMHPSEQDRRFTAAMYDYLGKCGITLVRHGILVHLGVNVFWEKEHGK